MATDTNGGHSSNFTPEASDAVRFATLRWYTLTIERLLLEIYVTDRSRYAELSALLKSQVKQLELFSQSLAVADPDDCPPGWKLCHDGLCSPMCDLLE
jgi:hypothetical protein